MATGLRELVERHCAAVGRPLKDLLPAKCSLVPRPRAITLTDPRLRRLSFLAQFEARTHTHKPQTRARS